MQLASGMNGGASRVRTLQTRSAVAFLALSLLLSALSHGEEPGTRRFDIAAETLSSALNEFARQSQQQVLFAPDVVAQKLSAPLRGEMQPIPALKLLLKDSGLVFKAMSNGVILVGDAHALSDEASTVVTRSDLNLDAGDETDSSLNSVTVEGKRGRAALQREVTNYVLGITTRPFPDLAARWQKGRPICPLVAGLPHDDGEYVLIRLSRIATAAGAPLAPEHCKPNFYVVVSSVPNELMTEWSKHDPTMWDSHPKAEVHQFMKATGPIRAFYNPGTWWGGCIRVRVPGFSPFGSPPYAECDDRNPLLDGALESVIVLVDAGTTKGINYAQLTAYIAMVGLVQIRLDAKLGDASTILQLFSAPPKAPPFGLSLWDQAYLKAVYHLDRRDKPPRLGIARLMTQEIAP
jgi:hypothetical protein